jgi:hypothetical protein
MDELLQLMNRRSNLSATIYEYVDMDITNKQLPSVRKKLNILERKMNTLDNKVEQLKNRWSL